MDVVDLPDSELQNYFGNAAFHLNIKNDTGRSIDYVSSDYVYVNWLRMLLGATYIEETVDRKTGKFRLFPYKKAQVFVQGKIYRHQYLPDNGIVWHPDIKGILG